MRKLNSFVDSKRAFLFLDVNSLPLCGFSYFQSILLQSRYDILFGSYSYAGRTLRKKYKFIFNQVLDDQIHDGYSCSLILGREGVIQDRDFELLSSPNLLNFIKKAPEQGCISILLSLSSLRHGSITCFLAERKLVEGKSFFEPENLISITRKSGFRILMAILFIALKQQARVWR